MSDAALTVPATDPADSRALEPLAGPTGRLSPPARTELVAERDGIPRAAITLTSSTVPADTANTIPDVAKAPRTDER
jgi:hypothetical protein